MVGVQTSRPDFEDVVVRVNRIMDQLMQKSFFRFRPSERWQPSMNLYETQNSYYVCLDLAGVDPEGIELHRDNEMLHVHGHRPTPAPEGIPSSRIHVMEIDDGMFQRSIRIPRDVDTERIEARHRNGLVWITMPKIGHGEG